MEYAGRFRLTLLLLVLAPLTLRHARAQVPEEALNAFEGIYHSPELDTEYRFSLEGDALRFHHRKLPSRTLIPLFEDAFTLDGATVIFSRDAAGKVDGFSISDGRVWNVRFDLSEANGLTVPSRK